MTDVSNVTTTAHSLEHTVRRRRQYNDNNSNYYCYDNYDSLPKSRPTKPATSKLPHYTNSKTNPNPNPYPYRYFLNLSLDHSVPVLSFPVWSGYRQLRLLLELLYTTTQYVVQWP